ncbi:MAG: hypothetical protein OXG23_09635 [Chloroflexi bacterium]|nr:hypothetical protein [Chloroflexota bacterium]
MAVWIVASRNKARVLAVVALVLPASIGVIGWKQHNAFHHKGSGFSSIGTYNLLYYRAAMVHYWAHGRQDIDATYVELATRVEEKLGNEVTDIRPDQKWEHRGSWPGQAAAMNEVALAVFLEHPLEYVLTLPVGIYRVLFEVKSESRDATTWRFHTFYAWVGLLWNSALLTMAGAGCWHLARQREWSTAAFLLLPCAYFILGTLLVQTSGIDTRARVMITPLLAIMAAYGVMRLLNRRRAASASP